MAPSASAAPSTGTTIERISGYRDMGNLRSSTGVGGAIRVRAPIPAQRGIQRTEARQGTAQREKAKQREILPGCFQGSIEPENHHAGNQPGDSFEAGNVACHVNLLCRTAGFRAEWSVRHRA